MSSFAKPYCEYKMGKNPIIFDKDHDAAEEGWSWIALGALSQK